MHQTIEAQLPGPPPSSPLPATPTTPSSISSRGLYSPSRPETSATSLPISDTTTNTMLPHRLHIQIPPFASLRSVPTSPNNSQSPLRSKNLGSSILFKDPASPVSVNSPVSKSASPKTSFNPISPIAAGSLVSPEETTTELEKSNKTSSNSSLKNRDIPKQGSGTNSGTNSGTYNSNMSGDGGTDTTSTDAQNQQPLGYAPMAITTPGSTMVSQAKNYRDIGGSMDIVGESAGNSVMARNTSISRRRATPLQQRASPSPEPPGSATTGSATTGSAATDTSSGTNSINNSSDNGLGNGRRNVNNLGINTREREPNQSQRAAPLQTGHRPPPLIPSTATNAGQSPLSRDDGLHSVNHSGLTNAAGYFYDRDVQDKLNLLVTSRAKFWEVSDLGFPLSIDHYERICTELGDHGDAETFADDNDNSDTDNKSFGSSNVLSPLEEPHVLKSRTTSQSTSVSGGELTSFRLGLISTASAGGASTGFSASKHHYPSELISIPRERTLRITLTADSIRADEETLYGWQHDQLDGSTLRTVKSLGTSTGTTTTAATATHSTGNNTELLENDKSKPRTMPEMQPVPNSAEASADSSGPSLIPSGGFGDKNRMKRVFNKLRKPKTPSGTAFIITSDDR